MAAIPRKPAAVRSNIIPPNRPLTVALIVGIIALIAYGVYRGDPATFVIVAALVVFFALPAILLYTANRRARLHTPLTAESDDADDADEPDDADHPHADMS